MRHPLLALCSLAVLSAGCERDGLGCPYDPEDLPSVVTLASFCGTACRSYDATVADIRRRRDEQACDQGEAGTCGPLRYTMMRSLDQVETRYFDASGALVGALLINADGGAECPRRPRVTVGAPPVCAQQPVEQLCVR